MHVARRSRAVLASLCSVAGLSVGAVLASPAAASATPVSWCWTGGGYGATCQAYWNQWGGGQTSFPNNQPVVMQCWAWGAGNDENYYTTKWFQVYLVNYHLTMWMPADEVWYQANVGYCP